MNSLIILDAKPGILSSCGCLYCQNCTKKLIGKSIQTCPTCKYNINFQNFKNLRDKNELSKIMFLFENQDLNIKKIQQSIKIQKKNRMQYIEFLERRLKSLITENKNLKKYFSMSNNNINTYANNENINNMNKNNMPNKNTINNYYLNNKQKAYINNSNASYNTDRSSNDIYNTPNLADRKSNLKRIEIKKSNEYKNSTKYSPYINRYDENLNNVKNLNAQTAFEQQYSNRQGNNINVNIHDDNSARRSNSFMNNISNRRSNNSSIEKNYISPNYGKYRY